MTATTADVGRLASTLANLIADHYEARRPIDVKTTRAAIVGATRVAHSLGYGMTPAHVEIIVRDFITDDPRPAGGGAFPTKRKDWQARVESDLGVLLAGLGG
jgi:hypothetical protein